MILQKQINYLSFLAVLLGTLWVYAPSLEHAPRSEQNGFFIEIGDLDSFGGMVEHTYSYTRTRIFGHGQADEILFRPLTFSFLCLEKWLFGYQFFYWQLTSLGLHLIMVWQLSRILSLVAPSRFVYLLAGAFSLTFLNAEMVTWTHIVGYLICFILMLEALYRFVLLLETGEQKFLWPIGLCLFLASLFFEGALVLNLILIGYFFFIRRTKILSGFYLSLPFILYFLLSFMDYYSRPRGTYLPSAHEGFHLAAGVYSFFKILSLSLAGPWMPCFLKIIPWYRLTLTSLSWKDIWGTYQFGLLSNINVLLLAAIVCLLTYGLVRVWNERKKMTSINQRALWLGTISLIFNLSYLAVLVVGRFNDRGIEHLKGSLYYFYPMILFNIISIYSFSQAFKAVLYRREIYVVAVFILFAAIGLNGYKTFELNKKVIDLSKRTLRQQGVDPKNYYFSRKQAGVADILNTQGRPDLALEKYSQAIEANPRWVAPYNNRGRIYQSQKRYDLALRDFNQALVLDPKIFEVYINRANLYKQTGQYREAAADYTTVIGFNPDLYELYYNRANIFVQMNNLTAAIDDYNQALKLAPGYALAYHNRSIAYSLRGAFKEALQDEETAKALGLAVDEGYLNILRENVAPKH